MRRFITFGPALVVLLTAVVTLIAAPAAIRMVGYAGTDATIQQARHTLDDDNILKAIDRATRAIADSVEPSVVHISVRDSRRMGQGSGWIYDAAGHVVTNAHVVRGVRSIMVQFQDGRAVKAAVVGLDPTTDIAVLKVDTTEGLFPATRASNISLHQGERVFAFGSPFGFKFSMSEGIISGLGRDPERLVGDGGFTNFIQTDAAVNPGNSGGPLVNVEGRVVGMNVAIATVLQTQQQEGQNSGISFAIPISTIESVVDQIINNGVVAKGYLGVSRPDSDAQNSALLTGLGFRGPGVFVTNVPKDGPAGKAGIQTGDIITKINGTPVTNVPAFRSLVANRSPGDQISVEISRAGEVKNFSVVLGTLPSSQLDYENAFDVLDRFGISQVKETNGELEISGMRSPSPAFRLGIRPQNRITAVDEIPVTSARDLAETLVKRGAHQGRTVKLTVENASGDVKEVEVTP